MWGRDVEGQVCAVGKVCCTINQRPLAEISYKFFWCEQNVAAFDGKETKGSVFLVWTESRLFPQHRDYPFPSRRGASTLQLSSLRTLKLELVWKNVYLHKQEVGRRWGNLRNEGTLVSHCCDVPIPPCYLGVTKWGRYRFCQILESSVPEQSALMASQARSGT